jgi:hypothetical protein
MLQDVLQAICVPTDSHSPGTVAERFHIRDKGNQPGTCRTASILPAAALASPNNGTLPPPTMQNRLHGTDHA